MNEADLLRVYREERNRSAPCPLPADFYAQAAALLARCRRESEKGRGDAARAQNLARALEDIVDLREKKLLRLALSFQRTGQQAPAGLTPEEAQTFQALCSALAAHRRTLASCLERRAPARPSRAPGSREKTLKTVPVRILRDVPAFVGADLAEYGPYAKGERVTLPAPTAEVLVARGLAEAASPSHETV